MDGLISVNAEYSEWIKAVSSNFKQCQIKAAPKVNEEMLRFYWKIGKELISLKAKSNLGNKFYEIVSKDLKKELPEVKSFSPTNLKYMQYFYELYASPQVVDLHENELSPQPVDLNEVVFKIPWGHHRYIIDKCKGNRKKALFFVEETLKNNWSGVVLLNFLDTNLYERKGKAINNFGKILPDVQSDLAQEMTKDNVLAKYAVNAVNVPIGILEYDMNNLIPEDYKSSMPTIQEIEEELKE